MSSNLMIGRMRDRIIINYNSTTPDEWGLTVDSGFALKLSANIVVQSGNNNEKYGVELDSEVITCLCHYRNTVQSGQTLTWERTGKQYEIKHVKPADVRYKSMIITAELLP